MSKSIATLSMYEWPETSEAIARFWSLIAWELDNARINAPVSLSRSAKVSTLWQDPGLIIGQTCGWPYANILRGKCVPFARFDYGLPLCPSGHYYSIYIGQSDDDRKSLESLDALLRTDSIAINGPDSQSGFHVFAEIAGTSASNVVTPENRIVSGSHRNSVKLVAEGKARIAAIDAVAFELAKRHDAEAAAKVAVLGVSHPKPGLPLITALRNEKLAGTLLDCVAIAQEKMTPEDRDTLLIRRILPACDTDYETFLQNPEVQGYRSLY